MDKRNRYRVDDEVLQQLADSIKGDIFVGIPVKVVEDSDGHTSHLQPLIKWVQRMPDGTQKLRDFPPIKDAPNHFMSGGGITTTMPIRKDDEGIALVMSRGIDVWHEKGSAQPAIDARVNSLSDAVYLPGLRSTPRKLEKYNRDAAEMRSDDGKHKVSMHPKDGPTLSADDGKHVVSVHPKDGIGVKTDTKLSVDAKDGTTFKGMAHFDDAVTSAKSFSAPTLNGQTGGGFQGIANALIGAVIGGAMVLAAMSYAAPGVAGGNGFALASLTQRGSPAILDRLK